MVIWGSLAGVLLLLSIILFIVGISRKKVSLAVVSLIPFVFAGIFGCYAAYLAVSETYHKVRNDLEMAGSGEAMYNSLFGESGSCVEINHASLDDDLGDDRTIYIKCRVCPSEIKRISNSEHYNTREIKASKFFLEKSKDVPDWFTPSDAGEDLIQLENKSKKGYTKRVFISLDSTRMYASEVPDPGHF